MREEWHACGQPVLCSPSCLTHVESGLEGEQAQGQQVCGDVLGHIRPFSAPLQAATP